MLMDPNKDERLQNKALTFINNNIITKQIRRPMRNQHRPILLANPKHKHRMAASFYIIEPASCRACSRVLAAFGCADGSCPQTGIDITAAPTAAAAAALAASAAAASTVVAHIRMESLLVGHVLHRLNATVR